MLKHFILSHHIHPITQTVDSIQQIMFHYNCSLNIWTLMHLTATKFKPLKFYHDFVWFLLVSSQSQSQSYVTTDGQSVITSRYRAHSGTCDQIFIKVRRLFSEICRLVFLGRPLWREVGSVICLSLSSNFPLLTSIIYVTCVLQFRNLYSINIKLRSVPSEYSRLCSVSYFSSNILQESRHFNGCIDDRRQV
jgi:hypothetical protein